MHYFKNKYVSGLYSESHLKKNGHHSDDIYHTIYLIID